MLPILYCGTLSTLFQATRKYPSQRSYYFRFNFKKTKVGKSRFWVLLQFGNSITLKTLLPHLNWFWQYVLLKSWKWNVNLFLSWQHCKVSKRPSQEVKEKDRFWEWIKWSYEQFRDHWWWLDRITTKTTKQILRKG